MKHRFLNRWTISLFFIALLPRIFGLGQFLISDEHTNIHLAGSAALQAFLRGDFRATYWHFYPGVTMSWLDALGIGGLWLLERFTGATSLSLSAFADSDILHLLVAVRLPYALLTALFVPVVYVLLRELLKDSSKQYAVSSKGEERRDKGQRTKDEANLSPADRNPSLVIRHSIHRSPFTIYHLPFILPLAAALLIVFDPFFLAHSRVVHGDAPVAVFMVLSALALFLYLRNGGWKMLAFSAINGALAALTKAPGQLIAIFVIVTVGGYWALQSFNAKRLRLSKRRALDILAWGGIALATFVLMWPSMWVDPIGTLAQMLNETFGKVDAGHLVYFMGQPTLDPGPWFYPYITAFRLTPVTAIGALFSIGVLAWRWLKDKVQVSGWAGEQVGRGDDFPLSPSPLPTCSPAHPLTCTPAHLLWYFVLFLLAFGLLSPKKQDRYLLPVFPVLDILAAIGWYGLWQLITSYELRITNYALRTTRYVFFSLLILAQIAFVLPWHPYYLACFNPLMGGLPRAVETTLVGWGEGMEQVADYLNQKSNAETLYVASTPSQTLLPYFKGSGENFYTNDVALRSDYVVIYRAQQQRLAPSPEIVREYLSREPEHVVEIHGVPYAWIYPNRPLIFSDVPADYTLTNIGFGEIMRLAGYQLSAVSGQQPALSLTNGSFVPSATLRTSIRHSPFAVSLVWHALPPIEQDRGPCYPEKVENVIATICPRIDYTVSVRVIAPDGSVVAQHDSYPANGLLPTSQWRVDDYVQDRHNLTLPADAPPGEYRIEVVVYNVETGDVLAGPVEVARFERSE